MRSFPLFPIFVFSSLLLISCLIGYVLSDPEQPPKAAVVLQAARVVSVSGVKLKPGGSEDIPVIRQRQRANASSTLKTSSSTASPAFQQPLSSNTVVTFASRLPAAELQRFSRPIEDSLINAREATNSNTSISAEAIQPGFKLNKSFIHARSTLSEGLIGIDPHAPGSTMAVNGRRVTVENIVLSTDGKNAGLDLLIDSERALEPNIESSSDSNSRKRWLAGNVRLSGFTEEKELFRMRWGWDAFAKAQRNAAETPVARQ